MKIEQKPLFTIYPELVSAKGLKDFKQSLEKNKEHQLNHYNGASSKTSQNSKN